MVFIEYTLCLTIVLFKQFEAHTNWICKGFYKYRQILFRFLMTEYHFLFFKNTPRAFDGSCYTIVSRTQICGGQGLGVPCVTVSFVAIHIKYFIFFLGLSIVLQRYTSRSTIYHYYSVQCLEGMGSKERVLLISFIF